MGIASGGRDGQISFRDWHPVGVEEYGYVAADPLDPNIIYGGKITRFDKRSGQVQNIEPEAVRSGKYRFIRTAPVLFSPIEVKTLYFAGNVLFKTLDSGHSWQVISPDLTRESWEIPSSVGIYAKEDMKKMPRRGVIYTVAPSPIDIKTIWCGTDDGLIHVTRDGGRSWQNVTPPGVDSWSKVSLMDAGHFDANTAYAAVNRIRLDDMKPHIYKTSDGGKNWKEIVSGLPADPINVVREDPNKKGLLFAGSERAVYVSFDEGDHWQSLLLNMPATSIRDLVIKEDDIVVGTHGRSFWILDDISPLRQLSASAVKNTTILYQPQTAYRIRWNLNTDTPIPQEEPAGQNPPDGAIINYYLGSTVNGEVVLEISDANGKLVRRFSSLEKPYEVPPNNVPSYWLRPQQILSGKAGSHRFMWDLHYTPLDIPPSYPIAAVYRNTIPNPTSPWVLPGTYTVKLIVDGKTYLQKMTVKMDPNVKTSAQNLQLQNDLSLELYTSRKNLLEKKPATENEKKEIVQLDRKMAGVFEILQSTDMPPTTQAINAAKELINRKE